MKKILYILMTVVALGMPATSEAKKVQVPKMDMFGIAASFSDTIVHFTNVQEIDSAWIEKKNKFLQARQLYSYQLRDYLASEQQMPRRTCIVYAGKNKKKVEKKYLKMRKLYMPSKKQHQGYDIRLLNNSDFQFKVIDLRNFYNDVNARD